MKKVLDTYSSKNDINIKQIVAYKDNILEIEEYKDGFKKDDTMNVMSVTKSVTSLLIGIAIDQGLIKSVDDYVMDYYKETYTPKRGVGKTVIWKYCIWLFADNEYGLSRYVFNCKAFRRVFWQNNTLL